MTIQLKLGKKAAKHDDRTFKLTDFLEVDKMAPPPSSMNWYNSVASWGVMLNDALGDCTCAAVGHGVQVASLNTSEGEYVVPDGLVLGLYQDACGYVPGDPTTDNGGVVVDVLNYVRKNQLGTHKLFAYVSTIPGHETHIKLAIQHFGIVDIGIGLPVTAQSQVGSVWDVVGDGKTGDSAPWSWGGHSVIVAAYNETGPICITWGMLQQMTWAFWKTYCDEAYPLLYRIWLEGRGGAGPINLPKMEQAIIQLG